MFFFHHLYYSIFLFLGDSERPRNRYFFVCNGDLIRAVGRLVREMFCSEEIGKFAVVILSKLISEYIRLLGHARGEYCWVCWS